MALARGYAMARHRLALVHSFIPLLNKFYSVMSYIAMQHLNYFY